MAHCAQCTADTFNLPIVGSIGSTGLEPYYPIIPEWLDKREENLTVLGEGRTVKNKFYK